jgi:hypothetical protein
MMKKEQISENSGIKRIEKIHAKVDQWKKEHTYSAFNK